MAILRDQLFPTVNSQVSATPKVRRNSMLQPAFGQDPNKINATAPPVDPSQQQGPNQQFLDQPITGDYIMAGLQKMAQRQAPPALDPGSRVKLADTRLTSPDNFQSFYDMLGSINQRGQEQLGAAQAISSANRLKAAQAIMAQMGGGSGGSSSNSGSSSSSNSSYMGKVPSNPAKNFQYAQNIAGQYGWDSNQLAAWYKLGMKESGWNNNAQNPTSTAYGIGQFLNSTWGGYGIAKTSDPNLQVQAMAKYIKARYGTPANALAFHISHNWY